tara:strand:- start:204 stop:332 length:129 start_codon:yes stop_codon:yes gene_type:complete
MSVGFSQQLDSIDSRMQELEIILQNAMRNSQRVFVEDFTGLQ